MVRVSTSSFPSESRLEHSDLGHLDLFRVSCFEFRIYSALRSQDRESPFSEPSRVGSETSMQHKPWQEDVCTVCGTAISRLEARLYDRTCSEYRCRSTYWRQTARRLQQEKQLQTRETARRRSEQALAHCKRLAAELNIAAPDTLLPIPLPAQQRPLVPLPETRKALFREHLERVVREAFQTDDLPAALETSDANDPASSPDELQQTLWAACGVCQGRCCLQGHDHAYLDVAAIRRYLARNPQATAEEICRDYETRQTDPPYEESCVYHQEHGCALPRTCGPISATASNASNSSNCVARRARPAKACFWWRWRATRPSAGRCAVQRNRSAPPQIESPCVILGGERIEEPKSSCVILGTKDGTNPKSETNPNVCLNFVRYRC